ncbi:MAG: ATP synthase F0 subunit B [Acidobacteria bacterium]|nr:ATP synthase F0 subunit B [Acidobacteriota bacterium]
MTRFRLISSLLLGAALAMAPISLRAQGHGAPQQESHEAPKHETPAAGHEAPAAQGDAHAVAGHGEAHAAPADGHGEAHGAAAAHHGLNWKELIFKLINFGLFIGIIWMAAAAKAKMGFKARAEELEGALRQAARDKAEGEAQIASLESKMSGLQAELDGILAKAEKDAEAEKARVIEAARAEAQTILAQTQSEIAFQQKQAEQELKALVAQLAVEGATARIQAKLQGATAASAIDKAITQIGNQGAHQ